LESSAKIKQINNKRMNLLGHIAGSPMDKGAGIYLHHHIGETVKKGEPIVTIYAESKARLDNAMAFLASNNPFVLG
jgi:AMP phosphorylase